MTTIPDPTLPAPPLSPTVRFLKPILSAILAIAALLWAADLYRPLGLLFLAEQLLAFVLGIGLALVFLTYPVKRGAERPRLPWYDAVLAIVAFAACAYLSVHYPRFLNDFFQMPIDALVVSWIIFVLAIEGLRRTAGISLVIIVLVFTVYALLGDHVPGALQTRHVNLNNLILYLGIDTSGLFGLVMNVGVTVVIPYILFGALLFASGGGNFFNDFALALMGRYRGGSAKIAITASGLFGSISGIVVSNIMATGVVTIPLMKRSGFSARQAAAIEATASTGGQLMPPVMGAVAFIMADFLRIPYSAVAVAALVPSILYYASIFIQADLEAAKMGITRVPESQIPQLVTVLRKGWHLAIPFAVLIYELFWQNSEPETAAIWASVAVIVVGFVRGYDGKRIGLRDLWQCVLDTGAGSLDILMISAIAGFIMGILQITGLGFALTLALVQVGAGNVFLLLVIAAVMCVVLGMGMPTVGVYVLLAVLVAPSLVQVGITPLAAHMFILYLGMMSMITPPVAIGAFFAAGIAGAEPMRTGYWAMRFAWTAFVIPFLFVFSPALLLQNPSWIETAVVFVTAIAGVWTISAGMSGYAFRPLGLAARGALLVGGFGLLLPPGLGTWALWANVGGLVLAGAVLAGDFRANRRERLIRVPAVPSE